MRPVRTLLVRALFLALLVLSLSSSVARADDSWLSQGLGDRTQDGDLFPEDPGFE